MAEILSWLDSHQAFWPVFIFLARITDVSIGTMRTICVVRGFRLVAAILGFFEVTIWILAVSGVFRHLDRWINIVAYGLGFASGNAVGIWLEQRMALGMQALRFISHSRSAAVAQGLRLAGYAVTEVTAHGRDGDVSLSFVVVPRSETPTAIRIAHQIDSDVFVTVEDVRSAKARVYRDMPPISRWRAFLKRK